MYSNDRQGGSGRVPGRPRNDARIPRASSNGGADARRRSAYDAGRAPAREGARASREGDSVRQGNVPREGMRDVRDASPREGVRASRGARTAPKKPRKKWPFVVAGAIVAAIAAIVIAFSCWRWPFSHDAEDIQGVWYIAGTQKTATITADKIELSDDVAYSYELDEGAKTLSLTFGTMTGDARYRFSFDRQELAIRDGETSSVDSLLEDIPWTLAALGHAIQGDAASPEFSGSQTMVLTRTPSSQVG